jgi:dienelactone hydrolase
MQWHFEPLNRHCRSPRILGYVALTVDTLGRRDLDGCYSGTYTDPGVRRLRALRYLATLEAVDPLRIAVLCQSIGGSAALYALDRNLAARRLTERFHAGVAFYSARTGAPMVAMNAPLLILICEANAWNPAKACRWLAAHVRPDPEKVEFVVYPAPTRRSIKAAA